MEDASAPQPVVALSDPQSLVITHDLIRSLCSDVQLTDIDVSMALAAASGSSRPASTTSLAAQAKTTSAATKAASAVAKAQKSTALVVGDVAGLTSEEALAKRMAKFGTAPTATTTTAAATGEKGISDPETLAKRAARFGKPAETKKEEPKEKKEGEITFSAEEAK